MPNRPSSGWQTTSALPPITDIGHCPTRSVLFQKGKANGYSITSSVRTNKASEIVMPSAFAVLRLMRN